MHSQRNKRKHRSYQIRKTGIKDEYIDRQILALHKAMVDKLLATPSLITNVISTLEERKVAGRIGYSEYITWLSLCELINHPSDFKEGVLEDSPRMRRFRRKTPFVNVLTESERQAALQHGAIGSTTNLDFLFS